MLYICCLRGGEESGEGAEGRCGEAMGSWWVDFLRFILVLSKEFLRGEACDAFVMRL